MVLSNVAGPQSACYLGGKQVQEMSFFTFLPVGFYCGILSYNGRVMTSFVSDSSLPNPEGLARCWNEEFEALHAEATAPDASSAIAGVVASAGPLPTPFDGVVAVATFMALAIGARFLWRIVVKST
mmetsp:Transcript_29690/g.78230  ORF Transcript_29690/g.78230 Transcript_29690/m.78230 type:complete len:126 (+) Transcript_29690:1605-1982(+)